MRRRRAARKRRARPSPRDAAASPRTFLRAGCLDAVAGLIDAGALVLIQEFAAQQPAGVLRHAPQPLLGCLLRGPFLDFFGAGLAVRGLIRSLLAGVRVLLIL